MDVKIKISYIAIAIYCLALWVSITYLQVYTFRHMNFFASFKETNISRVPSTLKYPLSQPRRKIHGETTYILQETVNETLTALNQIDLNTTMFRKALMHDLQHLKQLHISDGEIHLCVTQTI